MSYDALQRALNRLESFDADHWGGQLRAAQQQTEAAIAAFEQNEASRYSAEGQQIERERLRQGERTARERALREAEAGLRYVAEAKALLDTYTGLSEAEMRSAEAQRWQYQEDVDLLDAPELARKIQASVTLADKTACWCWVRYGAHRLGQLREDMDNAGDNASVRARAQVAIATLRPALEAAQVAIESPRVAELRGRIAEQEQAAGRLKARALSAPQSALRAAKLSSGDYGL